MKRWSCYLSQLLFVIILFLGCSSTVKANEAIITETYAADSKWVVPSALQCFDKASGYYSVTTSFTTNTTEIDGIKGKDYYTCNIGAGGVISFNLDEITSSNKLYSVALYISNYNNLAPLQSDGIGLGTSTYVANNDLYYSTNNGTLWSSRVNGPFNMYQPTSSSLNSIKYYIVYALFSSKSNSTSLAMKIDYSSNAANNFIWGYNLECLGDATGLTASDVEDIVSSSGFATASSVDEVQSSVEVVQEQLTEVQEQNATVIEQNEEAEETRKGIWQTIKDLPNAFLEMLKGLFIPEEEELQELIDNFKSTIADKLGAIYQVADLLIGVFQSVLDPPSENSCITFPEIKDPFFDKLLINETDYCFDTLRNDFDFLFTLSDMIISIVCTIAFANMLYKKYEGFIGGDSGDY